MLEARVFIRYSCLHSLPSIVDLDVSPPMILCPFSHFIRCISGAAVAWNSALRRQVADRNFAAALTIFDDMLRSHHQPDGYTYPLVLKACSDASALDLGRRIYLSVPSPNVFTDCAAIDMFAKCGSLNEARQVFEKMLRKDLVTWTTMIRGATYNGRYSEALIFFKKMRSQGIGFDSVTIATIAPACGRLRYPNLARALHAGAIAGGVSGDLCVLNSLIDMYCKCNLTSIAESIFSSMENLRDSISWGCLIAGYSQNRQYYSSFSLLAAMIAAGEIPSSNTLAGALPAISELKFLIHGRQIHCYAIKNFFPIDSFLASAIIDLYSRCGRVPTGEIVFRESPEKDISVWNSLITGYSISGRARSAFEAVRAIITAGIRLDSVTVAVILPLCSRLASLETGKELHGFVVRGGIVTAAVSNALIDFYCKCGLLGYGEKIFERAEERDAVTFNIIIAARGMHGRAREALSLFSAMAKEKIEPNDVTFVAVLSACSHSGLVEEGLSVFSAMQKPEMEHYACAVDLQGRAGRIEEAWEMVKKMPEEPGVDVLGSLLGACRVHGREDVAEVIGEWIMERKKVEDSGYYLLMANIYARGGRWEEAGRVRKMARERGLRKEAGRSWIGGESFVARDRVHPMVGEMEGILHSLLGQMKDQGYSCHGDVDNGDDEEETAL